ncbi:MAG: thymidylate synthase [Symbiobacteriia bacterium]
MFIRAAGYDELQARVMKELLRSKTRARPKKGPILELPGVVLELTNPRARLSRTKSRLLLFSCLGELLWYLSGRDDLQTISYYISKYADSSDDGSTLYGAYGPRLFAANGQNQLQNITDKLRQDPDSRQAMISLFDAVDLDRPHKDVPCTCSFQFLIRNQRLHMITYMRSNDVILGLPHDIFSFTMIQEVLARTLGYDVGTYKHMVGSLHLYEKDIAKAKRIAREPCPLLTPMPIMPQGDPWPSIRQVLAAEEAIRKGGSPSLASGLDRYWVDFVTLLQLHRAIVKDRNRDLTEELKSKVDVIYQSYVDKKISGLGRQGPDRSRAKVEQVQLDM